MEISIEIGTWQYNAGIVGLYNILKENNEEIKIEKDKFSFDSSTLENFEEKYFNYLIGKYEKTLSWYKIVEQEDRLRNYLKNGVENLSKEEFENLNKYVKDILKYYIKSNSYVAAYDLIQSEINPLEIEKSLKTVTLKKNEKIEDKKSELEDMINKSLLLIEYCKSGKKYLAGKNVIYTLIKNAWNGVSFLNAQTKEKDMYKDYKNYFIDSTVNYLNEDKEKYKYECFICDNKIKNFENDFSFLNQTGFDVARKSSHVWNFNNNIAMCPICKLVYSCIPAGFSYFYGNGIFVNANQSIEELINVNNHIYSEIYKPQEVGTSSITYRALNEAMTQQTEESRKYELADIQMVRYENEKYYFNILSKKMIKIIRESKDDLNGIIKAWYNEINTSFRIYEEVMKRILDNQNLYTLIYKLLYYKISRENDCHFNSTHILKLLKINERIMEGKRHMNNNSDRDFIKEAKAAGYYLRIEYEKLDAEHKILGICHRILNGIKTNNKIMVMETIFNSYMYIGSLVPDVISYGIREEYMADIGLSFISGFLGKKLEKNNENGGNE